jgi:rubredoxin
VAGGTNWKQISGDGDRIAAIKTDGTLWMWGYNTEGDLGDNTIVDKSSPVQTVAGGTNWKQTGGSAAIKTDGTLWVWGNGDYGAIGDGTFGNVHKSSPVQTIAGGTNWKQVARGYNTNAAIKTDGTLWTWGRANQGALGDPGQTSASSPVQTIAAGTNWKQVAIKFWSVAAIKTDGTLWMWGANLYGQLGDGTSTAKLSPVQTVAGGTNWKQVESYTFTAAIKTDGTLWTWGDAGSYGQLGDNTTVRKSSPVQTVAGGTNWKQVAVGSGVAQAIREDYSGTNPVGGGTFSATINSNQQELNLRTWALGAGWDGSSAATITVGSGVYIWSDSTSTSALTINGSWPGGVTVINNGYIMGNGGVGGAGQGLNNSNPAESGWAGGVAISIGISVTIDNTNASAYIGGGGGGGGGGEGQVGKTGYGGGDGGGGAGGGPSAYGSAAGGTVGAAGGTDGNGGGGGGSGGGGGMPGFDATSGGGGGRIFPGTGGSGAYGIGGNGGSSNAAGSGGVFNTNPGGGGGGGGGGGWGAAGGAGYNGAAGGGGGKAVALNGFSVTWTSGNATRVYGSVS